MVRGTVQAFDGGTYTGTVQLEGSPVYLDGLPVNRAIAAGEMVAGRLCAVVFWDATYPEDAMVLGVW